MSRISHLLAYYLCIFKSILPKKYNFVNINNLPDKTAQIEGLSNFTIGTIALIIWVILYLKINWLIINLFGIIFLTFGLYGMIRGIMEICYSVWTKMIVSNEKKSKSIKAKEVFLLITQIFGFALTVLNILKIFGLIGS